MLVKGDGSLEKSTTVLPDSPKQEEVSKDVEVSYNYIALFPSDPAWYGVIPTDVAFTDTNKDIDASVKLVNDEGGTQMTPYSESKKVKVTVQTVNGYKLTDKVGYKLDKDGNNTNLFTTDGTEQVLGTLDKKIT